MAYLYPVASKTRPSNTTTYTAGDVINESASAGTSWTLNSCVVGGGNSGRIVRARLESSANQTLKGQFQLQLFSTAPTADNDNDPFTPTDAENNNLVATINLFYADPGDISSGASGNCVYSSGPIDEPITCASTDSALYGVLIAKNAYVPVSGEVFRILLTVEV